MFNRVVRCLLIRKKPLNFKPNRQLLTVTNSQFVKSDLLLLKKCFGSRAVESPDIEEVKNETENLQESKDERSQNANVLEDLIKSDPIMEKRYKVLQLEYMVMKDAGRLVPTYIKPFQWVELLKEETRTARTKYLKYLFLTEKRRENAKLKKEEAKIEREKLFETANFDTTDYRLHGNTMFLRIYETSMHKFYHSRLFQSMMFGPKMVIDCGYHSQMTNREIKECAKQLAYLFAQNRMHRDPSDLYFCNADKSSSLMEIFHRIVPPAYNLDFPLNITEASYTEIFDRDKLVYLTPHCNNELQNYDHESIYIIGAIVDKTNCEPLSLAKAKKEKLKMAKLPLDKHLLWGTGAGKRLPLNQIVNILNDLRVTRNWGKALTHVARRKLEKEMPEPKENYVQRNRQLVDVPFQRNRYDNKQSFTFKARQNKSRLYK